MTFALEIAISALLVIGGLFGLIGSYGLLKLRQPMQRLHAPTKATTVGVGSALVASAIDHAMVTGNLTWHELMVTVFLLISAPLSALYLAKAHLVRTIDPRDLPATGSDAPWAELRGRKTEAELPGYDSTPSSIK